MNILIAQPKQEKKLEQLNLELQRATNIDIVLFPEGYFQHEKLEQVCQLAKESGVYIVAGYRDETNKDRALIINRNGKVILDRAKTPEDEQLYSPSKIIDHKVAFGYLLCREIFQGIDGLDNQKVDILFNPIGVGMFSEEQFEQWTDEAKKIARNQQTIVIGTSHADGSYRNCGISIPIAYCFDGNGQALLLSKNDVRTRVIDLKKKVCTVLDE